MDNEQELELIRKQIMELVDEELGYLRSIKLLRIKAGEIEAKRGQLETEREVLRQEIDAERTGDPKDNG